MATSPVNSTAPAALRRDAEALASRFPALLAEARRAALAVSAGQHGRRRPGVGETFWQHRPYAFGDPAASIDWRQSARAADRLYVRQNEWEAPAAIWIWRDQSPSLDYACADGTPLKSWRADVLSTAMAILLCEAGERVGLLGGEPRLFQGRTAPARFLEALLTEQRRADPEAAPSAAVVAPGAHVILVSDFFMEEPALQDAAASFVKNNIRGALLQIIDPAEEDFPFSGRVEFQDMRSADRRLFGNAGKITARYRERVAAHRRDLAALARRLGWTLVSHRTDRPAATPLSLLYAAIGGATL